MIITMYELLGLIKDGKAPKKIKKNWEYEYKYDGFRNEYHYMNHENKRFDEEWLIFSIINDEIEILDEEDEFIDIEELKLDGDFGGYFLINDEGNKCHISSYDKTIVRRINKVIKNQKKIIERINKDN